MSQLNDGRLVAQPDDALLWHDGLLLEPAHFQQLCQRQEQLVSYHVRSAAPHNWGVRQLVIADKSLSTNLFSVSSLEAIMPDGLLVSHRAGSGNLDLALSEALRAQLSDSGQAATVCLAVPLGEAQRSMPSALPGDADGDGDGDGDIDSDSDGDGAPVLARVRPRMRLALASELEKQASDAVLPLARIRCVDGRCSIVQFMPPMLDSQVAPPWPDGLSLHERSVALVNSMQRTLNYLIEATRIRPVGVDEQLRRIELRQRAAAIGAAIPLLRGLLGLEMAAPLDLYLAWCGALGSLGALDESGEVVRAPFPDYRHADLAATFAAVFARAEALVALADLPFAELRLDYIDDKKYYLHQFDGQYRYRWPVGDAGAAGAAGGAVLIVGLRGLTEQQACRWMERAVITASQRQADWRAGRRAGAARSLIRSDGTLLPLSGDGRQGERKVALHGMSTPGVTLFAIDPEAGYAGDPDIVLENGAKNDAIEAVLFRHRATS